MFDLLGIAQVPDKFLLITYRNDAKTEAILLSIAAMLRIRIICHINRYVPWIIKGKYSKAKKFQ